MQSRLLLALAVSGTLAGCALLGFGPPMGIIEGWVVAADTQEPLPRAEVCAFGVDTTCQRADREGHYRMRLTEQTVVLRFRSGSLATAVSDSIHVIPDERIAQHCGLTSRLVLSDHPLPCQPVSGR